MSVLECGCVPVWLSSVEKCGAIMLNYCGLEKLPCDKMCTDHRGMVVTFYLKRNKLSCLPADLSKQYPSLTELHLPSNRICALPSCIGRLCQLQHLDVSDNELEQFPPSISGLVNLIQLHAAHNNLKKFPSGLENLQRLEVINVSHNRIYLLPKSISSCRNLKRLHISSNNLTTIPYELCTIPNLEQISLCSNKLIHIPIDVAKCKKMISLDIDNNVRLNALPFTLLEIGCHYEGCGRLEPSTLEPGYKQLSLEIEQENIGVSTVVPESIKARDLSAYSQSVPSLKEMSSLLVYRYFRGQQLISLKTVLPLDVWDAIMVPFGHCYNCNSPMFWEGFVSIAHMTLSDCYSTFERKKFYWLSYTCAFCR